MFRSVHVVALNWSISHHVSRNSAQHPQVYEKAVSGVEENG